MSRDMKSRTPARKKSGGSTLVGVFVGVVIGVLIALAVIWYVNVKPAPFVNKAQPEAAPAAKAPTSGGAAGEPVALPGKPGDPVPEKPRFDFYKILPGNAEAIPEPRPAEPAKAADAAKEMFLQAGSFQNPGEADNLKARLALMGLEASVQQIMLGDKVWYRVRLGPYVKIDELNRVRGDLAKAGIDASLAKKD